MIWGVDIAGAGVFMKGEEEYQHQRGRRLIRCSHTAKWLCRHLLHDSISEPVK
jgi:hypothetical protein